MASFELTRRAHIDAPPARVHELVDDFHSWTQWSPWEDVDPDLRRTFSGAESGVGARYAWAGNRKAGEGSMEILRSDATQVDVDLRFLKPFKAHNLIAFSFTPAGAGTDVAWTMSGDRNPVMGLLGRLYFDKAVGRDFEKGLARLKRAAEG
jgi:hypothetical protein